MAKDANRRKSEVLGMNASSADSLLKKMIIFDLATKLSLLTCFRCGEQIDSMEQFTKDHKEAWLSAEDPKRAYFDLDNIAFSHLSCNSKASTGPAVAAEMRRNRV